VQAYTPYIYATYGRASPFAWIYFSDETYGFMGRHIGLRRGQVRGSSLGRIPPRNLPTVYGVVYKEGVQLFERLRARGSETL
jgi:hypothetical protein